MHLDGTQLNGDNVNVDLVQHRHHSSFLENSTKKFPLKIWKIFSIWSNCQTYFKKETNFPPSFSPVERRYWCGTHPEVYPQAKAYKWCCVVASSENEGRLRTNLNGVTRTTTFNRVDHDNIVRWGEVIKNDSIVIICIWRLHGRWNRIKRRSNPLYRVVFLHCLPNFQRFYVTKIFYSRNFRRSKCQWRRYINSSLSTSTYQQTVGTPSKNYQSGLMKLKVEICLRYLDPHHQSQRNSDSDWCINQSRSEKSTIDRKLSSFTRVSDFLGFQIEKILLSSFHKQDRNRAKMLVNGQFLLCMFNEVRIRNVGIALTRDTQIPKKKSLLKKITKLIIVRFRSAFEGCEKIDCYPIFFRMTRKPHNFDPV